MMKKLGISAILIMVISTSYAQGIFGQQNTQLRRLAEQIAALKAYKGIITEGYNIVKSGAKTIGDLKNGEFSLHSVFFNSQSLVNPQIRHWSLVGEVISAQLNIIKTYNSSYRAMKSSGVYREDELRYIYQVFGKLLDDCEQAIKDLMDVTTDGRRQMSDDERITKIKEIYQQMRERRDFTQRFSSKCLHVGADRASAAKESKVIKQWFFIE